MRSLAQEVAAARIEVNAIAPVARRTPINKSAGETAKAARRPLTLIPYGLDSDYVVGATLFVDVDGDAALSRIEPQQTMRLNQRPSAGSSVL